MNTSRPHRTLSPAEKQAVRERAVELHENGMGATEIAEKLGVSRQIVHRWVRAKKEEGPRALHAKKLGRPSNLDEHQCARLVKMLLENPLAHGFPTQLWTLPRIAELIEREFGVAYHPRSPSPLLRRLGFSCQKPEKRAVERDEDAIRNWVETQWPEIKKKGARRE